MAGKKNTTEYYLRVRTYPETAFVAVWLIRRDGAANAGLLWGLVLPEVADEIAAATGLEVQRDETLIAGVEPNVPPGCATPAQQKTLFEGE